MTDYLLSKGMTNQDMVEFLREASRYFLNRDTNGEDKAYWSNVYNSEKCNKIADYLEELKKGFRKHGT